MEYLKKIWLLECENGFVGTFQEWLDEGTFYELPKEKQ